MHGGECMRLVAQHALVGANNGSHTVLLANPLAKHSAGTWAISYLRNSVFGQLKSRPFAWKRMDGSTIRFTYGADTAHLSQWNQPILIERSIQLQQVDEDLIYIPLPFRQISDGQDGIDPVVASAVNGLDVKSIQLENAEDVAVLNNTLGQTNSVVPHIIRFLVKREAVESSQVHFDIY